MTSAQSRQSPHHGPALLAFVILVVAAAFALAVDVPRTGYGIKSDEATYVATALSVAYDGNLSFERRDLERFAGLYHSGPEGIFLKRGQQLRIRASSAFPFVRMIKLSDPNPDRVFFAKSLIYPVFAAPFVRIFGLNGLLLFHTLLLAAVAACGYFFLAAQSPPAAAAAFTTAFLGAAALPVYGVLLMPEIFNFSFVFFAYFLWLYKEVAPASQLRGAWTDLVAAVLLGLATYSKPIPIGLLVAPLVLLACWRRRWAWGFAVGALAVVMAAACFGLTAAVSGEFNYQGGDRKTFYALFPFDAPDATWERRGIPTGFYGSAVENVLTSSELLPRLARNIKYFLIGRHFGFVPYFFPGVIAIGLWLFSRARRDIWRIITFGVLVVSTIGVLLLLPFTWSGGGGPPGNRYFLTLYATVFFLVPPLNAAWPGVLAWIGGALFTAKMLMNPFVAAKFTYLTTEKGPARRLPVELTMANDLPIMLDASRSHIPYGHPVLLLYFLDQKAFSPEPAGMWVSGSGRADILVRSVDPIQHLAVDAESPIRTTLTVSMGADAVSIALEPGKISRFDVPASGVRGLQSYAYLLSARSSEGFVPHVMDPQSADYRNLGAQMRFKAVIQPTGQ